MDLSGHEVTFLNYEKVQKYIKNVKNFSLNELRVPKNRIKFHTFRAQPFFSGKSRFQLKNAVLRHIKQI